MSKKLYEESNVRGIADAIREQNGTQDSYTVAQMGNAIRAIHTQPNLETLNATQNGTYTPPSGVDGYSRVTVNVSGGGSSNDNYIINPDNVYAIQHALKTGTGAPSPYIYLKNNPTTKLYYDISTGDGTVSCWQLGGSSQSDAGICFVKKIPASANRLVLEGSVTSVSPNYGAIQARVIPAFSLSGDPWDDQGGLATKYIVKKTQSSLPYQQFEMDLSSVSVDTYFFIYIVYAIFNIHAIWYE